MSATPTYFTCTLGQAATLGLQQPYKTVNEFLDHKATHVPHLPAVGFAVASSEARWRSQLFSYSDVRRGSISLARYLQSRHTSLATTKSTVALLCPSTPEFLFTWLALIRLGHAVLLVAPQCAPNAIDALCEQCGVQLILYDDAYTELATQSAELAHKAQRDLQHAILPFDASLRLVDLLSDDKDLTVSSHPTDKDDIAYLHHTSGTSTGIPKPIPQPHNAAIGVLPEFTSGSSCATFTTTPLYHGGIADLFRAWASSALIWLFPGKGVPITASNIIKCLELAKHQSEMQDATAPVKYFSSVPYVLQLLESDSQGLKHLQGMEMVGVGGAALPVEVGDRLVSNNVNLLSRFGSAECGFLLSSHRDYANDKAWQYLRPSQDQSLVRFETRDAGLGELIVLDGWPHMAKRNRNDKSYATADLFAPHDSIKDAWKYHSRADSQLTLITGKKFDPAPIEADVAASDLLSDAIVFGNGQPYPGVLLFRSDRAVSMSDAELIQNIWPVVERSNQGSQDHAKISKALLIPMANLEVPLEKSSKGTLLRGAAESRFEGDISRAYDAAIDEKAVDDSQLPAAIKDIVSDVSHKTLPIQGATDLFSAGIDSVAGMQIRSRLRSLLPADKRKLPMTIVEDCGSIDGLARYIRAQRHGQETYAEEDQAEYMRHLVKQYSQFRTSSTSHDNDVHGQTIVLTGATGALGAHILDRYRQSPNVRKVYCLVRGSDEHAARERVDKGLQQRKLASLESDDKVVILQARLGDADLGLEAQVYEQLAREATTIMHVAWSVNFRLKLTSFVKDNIASVSNLINLALSSPYRTKPAFAFCSSVASAMAHDGPVSERILQDPSSASPLGYSQSKWVAEQICDEANNKTALAGRISIFRVGQLAGDSKYGVWNSSEAWPLMLSSTKQTGVLPALDSEVLDWLPVDIAATALIQGAQAAVGSKDVTVYHIVNDNTTPAWSQMISWLREHKRIEAVPPKDWIDKMSHLAETGSSHPSFKLLSHWQKAFGSDNETTTNGNHKTKKLFVTTQTRSQVPVLAQIEPVSEAYFWKLWEWIDKDV